MLNDPAKLLAEAQAQQAKIETADTEENFQRLQALAEKVGCKVKRRKRGVSGYAFVASDKSEISGVTLADIEDVIAKIQASTAQ